MFKVRITPLFLICLLVSLTTAAADFWTKKPYPSWSVEETQKMLADSPWAITLMLGGSPKSFAGGLSQVSGGGELEDTPNISYTIQFRSAQPIRQAQVRTSQLGAHYDKMTAEQKAAFDANTGKFLSATFPDRIVVAVTFQSNVQNYQSELRTYWMNESLPKQSMKVFLNTGTERLSLTSYSYKDDTFQFVFARPKDLPPDGKVSVEFVHPRIEKIGEQRIFEVFSLKKMLVDGQPVL
jgi:hypothetical protein